MKDKKLEETTIYYIRVSSKRPDFRLVITFLLGDMHNVDTEGDSNNPASDDWTMLYCKNREKPEEVFEIFPIQNDPLIFEVQSPLSYIAARVTYFLASQMNSQYAEKIDGIYTPPDSLIPMLGNFALEDAKLRVVNSRWQHATLQNPYPMR